MTTTTPDPRPVLDSQDLGNSTARLAAASTEDLLVEVFRRIDAHLTAATSRCADIITTGMGDTQPPDNWCIAYAHLDDARALVRNAMTAVTR